jgi:phosphate transport system substrate-binding protein
MRSAVIAFLLLAALVTVPSLLMGGRQQGHQLVSVIGSTSIQPFAEMLAEDFNKKHAGTYVEVQGGGSTAGIEAVRNGIADIGMCSRNLKPDEKFASVTIARDGLAVVVNTSNPLQDLSLRQVRDIFAGRITRWSQVGGPDQPIRTISREEGSGTREAFVKLVMDKDRVDRRALTQESNGAVRELVSTDPYAIGYMSLGLVGDRAKALAIDGVKPSDQTVRAGQYPLVRPFLFVLRGQPTPAAQSYIDFVLSSPGQALLEKEGLIRAQ